MTSSSRVLILLAPSKDQNFTSPPKVQTTTMTTPVFHESHTLEIVKQIKGIESQNEMSAALGKASSAISNEALQLYRKFEIDVPTVRGLYSLSTSSRVLRAIHAFNGVAFKKIAGRDLSPAALRYACDNIRVL